MRNTVTHNGQPQVARYLRRVISFGRREGSMQRRYEWKESDRCRHNNASTLSNDLCRNDACPRRYPREMWRVSRHCGTQLWRLTSRPYLKSHQIKARYEAVAVALTKIGRHEIWKEERESKRLKKSTKRNKLYRTIYRSDLIIKWLKIKIINN